MGRKCSHCGNVGHNSRTCASASNGGSAATAPTGVRLFGVQLMAGISTNSSSSSSSSAVSSMKKSFSMDCLSTTVFTPPRSSPSPTSSSFSSTKASLNDSNKMSVGYLSDALLAPNTLQDRKKGTPWTEEEHRAFLLGLEKLGKGDWRGISRNFVNTRTPTQVASHAQKYFLRQTTHTKKKRRSSLFDLVEGNVNNTNKSTCPSPSQYVDSQTANNHHEAHHYHCLPVLVDLNSGEDTYDDQSELHHSINPISSAHPSLILSSNHHHADHHHQLKYTPPDLDLTLASSSPSPS